MSDLAINPAGGGNVTMYTEPQLSSPDLVNDIASALDDSSADDSTEDIVDDQPETSTEEASQEANQEQVSEETEEVVDEEQQAEEQEQTSDEPTGEKKDEAASAAATTDLPEGVKVRNINGKPTWTLDPEVGKATFARAALVQKAEEIFGEPLTEQALDFRQRTVQGNEHLRTDLLSDDPKEQSRALAHFEEIFTGARERGEIGHDAMAQFVQNAVGFGLTSNDPGTRTATAQFLLKTTIEDTYRQALGNPDEAKAKQLWAVAQNLEKESFGTFRKSEDFAEGRKQAPQARFSRPNPQADQQQTNQPRTAIDAAQQYEAWSNEAGQAIDKDSVDKAVDEALSHIPETARAKNPVIFKSLRDQLKSTVREALRADQPLQDEVIAASRRAKQATKAEIRNQITTSLVSRHLTRAQQILKDKKGPILSEFAHVFAEKSNATRDRVQAGKAAARTVSSAGGPSASRTTREAPQTGSFKSEKDFAKELDAAFA